MKMLAKIAILTVLIGLAAGPLVRADSAPRFDTGALDNGATATSVKPKILDNVGIDQKLDAQLPMDAVFTDETGKTVKLGDMFGKRPVLLTLVQYSCQFLCTAELNGMCRACNACAKAGLEPGKDYDLLTISFDPRETLNEAALKKRTYEYQINADNVASSWHFLTGSPDSIKAITDAVGFRYVYDAEHDQYIHSGALMIVTPDGHLSKYLYGAEYQPNDVRLSVADAGLSKIGTLSDVFLMYCWHYDPVTGKWTLAVRNMLRVGATLTLGGLGLFIGLQIRRERRRAAGTGLKTV
jgi:protein SCO1/2